MQINPPPGPTFSNANPANGSLNTNPPTNTVTAGQEITFTVSVTPSAGTTLTETGFGLSDAVFNNGAWNDVNPDYTQDPDDADKDYVGFTELGTSVLAGKQVKTLNGNTFKWTRVTTETAGARTFTWVVPADFTNKLAGAKNVMAWIGGKQANFGEADFAWAVQVNPINQAPVITNTNPPAANQIANAAEGDAFSFTVTANDPDLDQLTYAWDIDNGSGAFEPVDGENGTTFAGNIPFDQVAHPAKSAANVRIRVTVSDGDGGTAQATWTIAQMNDTNQAPNAPAVAVTPAGPVDTTQALTATVTPAGDPDDRVGRTEPLEYQYIWEDGNRGTVRNSGWISATTDILLASLTEKNETYTCTVTVRDNPYGDGSGSLSAAPVASNGVNVINTAPAPSQLVTANAYTKIVTSVNVVGHEGQTLDLSTLVTDADGAGDLVNFAVVGPDPNMADWNLNAATGICTFTPIDPEDRDLAAGEYDTSFVFNVTDGSAAPLAANITVNLQVRNNQPPAVVNPVPADEAQTINEGQSVEFSVSFSDFGNVPQDDGIKSIVWQQSVDGGEFADVGTPANFIQPYTSPQAANQYTLNTDFNTSRKGNNAVITVRARATDGMDVVNTRDWTVTVNDVNQTPAFTKGADVTVLEDSGAYVGAGWATGISAGANEDTTDQVLTFNVTGNTNPGLFAAGPAIAADGTLSFTPALNANGQATVTITLSDDAGALNGGSDTSAPQSFVITVTAINDQPSFTIADDEPESDEDAGQQTVPNFATDISRGPADEAGQTVAFEVTDNTNPDLFSTAPAISPTGTLTYTAALDASGNADITVVLTDNGGNANGGNPTSAQAVFTITVNPVNDAPIIQRANGFAKMDELSEIITLTAYDKEEDLAGIMAWWKNPDARNGETALAEVGNQIVTDFGTLEVVEDFMSEELDGERESVVIGGAVYNFRGTVKVQFTPVEDFRGVVKFGIYTTDTAGEPADSDEAELVVTVGTPQWYPYFAWNAGTREAAPWFNVQIWEGIPDAEEATLLLQSNVNGLEMTPVEYFNAGSTGLLPGDYTWRVRTWDPATNVYGEDWYAAGNGRVNDAFSELIVDDYGQALAPTGLDAEENAAGDFTLFFTPENAQGFVVEMTGPNGYANSWIHVFQPDEDGVIPLNQEAALDVLLNTAGTYNWRVRGFNPVDTADDIETWTDGAPFDVVLPGGYEEPAPGQPTGMLPPNGTIITAPAGSVLVNLQWNPVAGAAGYVIYLAPTNGAPIFSFTNVGNVTSRSVTLPPGNYMWNIIAVNANGTYGAWSAPHKFDIIQSAAVPVIQTVAVGGADTLNITLAAGSSPAVTVDIYHFNGAAWVTYLAQPVVGGTVTIGGAGFAPGQYLLVRGTNAAGTSGEFKLFGPL